MVVRTRFERIYNTIESIVYTEDQVFSESREVFIYGFKYKKTDKVNRYNLVGCESDELNDDNQLFNFWSKINLKKEIEK